MWRDHAALKSFDLSWLEDDAAVLLIEVSGETMEAPRHCWKKSLPTSGKADLKGGIVAQSSDQARRFWDLREDSGFYLRKFPMRLIRRLDAAVGARYLCGAPHRKPRAIGSGLDAYVYGHIADGNLHIAIAARSPAPGDEDAVRNAVYAGIQIYGGSFSRRTGRRSTNGLPISPCRSRQTGAFRQFKAMLDPDMLFNPGKAPF